MIHICIYIYIHKFNTFLSDVVNGTFIANLDVFPHAGCVAPLALQSSALCTHHTPQKNYNKNIIPGHPKRKGSASNPNFSKGASYVKQECNFNVLNLKIWPLELLKRNGPRARKNKRLRSSNISKHQFEVELLHWQKRDIYWHSYPSSHGSSSKAILIYLERFFLNDPNQLGRPPKKILHSTNQNNSQLAPGTQVYRAAAYFVGSNCSNLHQHPKDGEVAL